MPPTVLRAALLGCLLSAGCARYAIAPPARAILGGPLEPGAVGSGQAGAGLVFALSGPALAAEASSAVRLAPGVAADVSVLSVGFPGAPGDVLVGSVGGRFSPSPDGALRPELSGFVGFGCGIVSSDQNLAPFGCPNHFINGFGLGGSLGVRTSPGFMPYLAARYQASFSSQVPWTSWGQIGAGFRIDVAHFFLSLDGEVLLLDNPTLNFTAPTAMLTMGFTWR